LYRSAVLFFKCGLFSTAGSQSFHNRIVENPAKLQDSHQLKRRKQAGKQAAMILYSGLSFRLRAGKLMQSLIKSRAGLSLELVLFARMPGGKSSF
jgi:hypothetical protein